MNIVKHGFASSRKNWILGLMKSKVFELPSEMPKIQIDCFID